MKRHDSEEISAMLRLADDMVKDGKSQKEACKALGISVMTFHRWRKLELGDSHLRRESLSEPHEQEPVRADPERLIQIDALRLENERLRRIVSDLLLEKMKVQEALDKTRK